MRLLLTGFEPFGGSEVNPSQAIVESLAANPPDRIQLVPLILPVVGGVAPRRVVAAIRRTRPDAVLLLGESAAIAAVAIERVAVNLRDYPVADNAGRTVQDRPVVRGGPAAHLATLPVRRVRGAMLAAGVPAILSLSAGTYLCNEVMYAALHELADGAAPCGFIHVPRLPRQVLATGGPSMDLDVARRGVAAAIIELGRPRAAQPAPRRGPDRARRSGSRS